MTETPNLPAVDDAIEGTVVDPWHVTAERIELDAASFVDFILHRLMTPPPEPDHRADPPVRARMAADPGEWFRAGVVPGFLPVQPAPFRGPDTERMRRFQADYAIGLSVHRPGDLTIFTGML